MSLTIKYFGLIGEITKKSEETFLLDETVNSLHSLLQKLKEKYPGLQQATYSLAVNQSIVKEDITLNDRDEIALLPPFAGG